MKLATIAVRKTKRMTKWLRTCTFFALVLPLLVSIGCWQTNLRQAGGIVKVDGVPVSDGSIEFYPVNGGRTATATIQPDGTYVISYHNPGDGLPIGEYKVAVISDVIVGAKRTQPSNDELSGDVETSEGGRRIHRVPRIYNSIQTTPLRQTVVDAADVQFFEFDIPSRAKR